MIGRLTGILPEKTAADPHRRRRPWLSEREALDATKDVTGGHERCRRHPAGAPATGKDMRVRPQSGENFPAKT